MAIRETSNRRPGQLKEGSDASEPVAEGPYNSIFQREWWLDTVAPGQWRALEVSRDNQLVARMPIVMRRRAGLRLNKMPRLTQTLGPWLAKPPGSLANQLAKQREWLSELTEQIPSFDYYCQNWHHSVQDWLPFLWRGFHSSLSTTYILPDLSNPEEVWRNYRSSVRGAIRKAEKTVTVEQGDDADVLYDMTSLSFGTRGRTPPYSREYLQRLVAACCQHESGRVFVARDSQGRIHGALLLVWDANSAYYLVSGIDPAHRSSGSMSLLMHEAISFASKVSSRFDFEGSVVKPIEFFVRSFGAEPRPFITLRGYSRRFQIIQGFRDMLRPTAA